MPVVGGDTLSAAELVKTVPGFRLAVHAGVRLPWGRYDSNSPLNVGANRYEFRIGLPATQTFGTPGRQTTLELAPVVYFHTDNNDPYGAGHAEMAPVYQIEAHATHDFMPGCFAHSISCTSEAASSQPMG